MRVFTAARGSRRVGAGVAVAIALGAGACIALLTVHQNVFATPPSYADPDRLVVVENRGAYDLGPDVAIERPELSWPDYRDLLEQQRSFETVGGLSRPDQIAWDVDGRQRSVARVFVTEALLATLGVRPMAGRLLGAADFDAQAAPVAVVSERLWRRQLYSDPGAVGRSYQVDGVSTTIVGVIADDVLGSLRQRREIFEDADQDQRLILPLVPGGRGRTAAMLALRYQNRSSPMLTVVARLRPDTAMESARTDVGLVSQRLRDEFPQTNRARTMEFVRLADWRTHEVIHLRPMLLAVALLALLVACASAVGLMMSDAVRRGPEMAVRHALGATHAVLASLVLRRALAWTLPGGLLGIALGWGMLRLVDVAGLSESAATRVHAGPWLFAGAAALGVLAGLVLAAAGIGMLRHQDLAAGLKEAGASTSTSRRRRLALSMVVAVQVGTATALCLVCVLLFRSMANLYAVDLGFDPGQTFTVRIQLPPEHYPGAVEQSAFFDRALARLQATPGVASAAMASAPPLSQFAVTINASDFALEVPGREPEVLPPLLGQHVSAGYFETVGTRLVRGRGFSGDDVRSRAPVVVVDEGFWKGRFGDVDPLQVAIRMGGRRHAVIGVVAGVRHGGPASSAHPTLFLPRHQVRSAMAHVVVRPAGRAPDVARQVTTQLTTLDPRVLVDDPQMLSALLARTVANRERMLRLLAIAAGMVLLLTVFSVAGALSQFVQNRVRELGLRKALGASPRQTVALVCRSVAVPSLAGALPGTLGGWLLARALSSHLYGVEPLDLLALAVTAAGLAGAGVVAAASPIRRALRIDPASALRAL